MNRKKKRSYGRGRLFQRGKIWWISWCQNGKERRESTNSTSETVATSLLNRRQGQLQDGKVIPANQNKVTVEELIELVLLDHKVNGRTDTVKYLVPHLRRHFGLDKAMAIRDDRLLAYVISRRDEGSSDGSITLEFAVLARGYNLAIATKRLSPDAKPKFPKIRLNNAREGFVSHAQFLALRDRLPEHLKDPVAFLYYSGWRVSEMRKVEWKHVDPSGKSLRLPPHLSKNNNGRLLPLTNNLGEIIQRARQKRRLDQPRLFHHNGHAIGDFRKAWQTACAAVGLGGFINDDLDGNPADRACEIHERKRGKRKKYTGLIVHDLRRSCVRNLVQAGVPEKTAMRLTGHKTRAIFDRYNIISDEDLTEASQRHQEFLAKQNDEPKVIPIHAQGGN